MRKILLLSAIPLVMLSVSSGCGSAPKPKGYEKFYGTVETAYEHARDSQYRDHAGTFAKSMALAEAIQKESTSGECFKIISASSGFGILEPDTVFLAENGANASERALVIVPPILEERGEFPTPAESPGLKVFRVDQDAPHGPRIISLLHSVLGRNDICVKFTRLPATEDPNVPVISAFAFPKSGVSAMTVPPSNPDTAVKPAETPVEQPVSQAAPAEPAAMPADTAAAPTATAPTATAPTAAATNEKVAEEEYKAPRKPASKGKKSKKTETP